MDTCVRELNVGHVFLRTTNEFPLRVVWQWRGKVLCLSNLGPLPLAATIVSVRSLCAWTMNVNLPLGSRPNSPSASAGQSQMFPQLWEQSWGILAPESPPRRRPSHTFREMIDSSISARKIQIWRHTSRKFLQSLQKFHVGRPGNAARAREISFLLWLSHLRGGLQSTRFKRPCSWRGMDERVREVTNWKLPCQRTHLNWPHCSVVWRSGIRKQLPLSGKNS